MRTPRDQEPAFPYIYIRELDRVLYGLGRGLSASRTAEEKGVSLPRVERVAALRELAAKLLEDAPSTSAIGPFSPG